MSSGIAAQIQRKLRSVWVREANGSILFYRRTGSGANGPWQAAKQKVFAAGVSIMNCHIRFDKIAESSNSEAGFIGENAGSVRIHVQDISGETPNIGDKFKISGEEYEISKRRTRNHVQGENQTWEFEIYLYKEIT